SGGFVHITAETPATMLSVAATLGVADDAGIAVSAAIADIHSDTRAYIDDPTMVAAGGAITISAQSPFKTTMVAGSVGGAGTAGIGAANTTLVHTATTEAFIGAGAQVSAGDTGVSIIARASEDIVSIAAGIGVGGTAGVAGSAAVNVLNETTKAYVGAGA